MHNIMMICIRVQCSCVIVEISEAHPNYCSPDLWLHVYYSAYVQALIVSFSDGANGGVSKKGHNGGQTKGNKFCML